MGLWPQWRSPLVWDVFAVSTYATVSLLFWYVGLIPDLATLRDRAKNRWAQYIYGFLAMGWRGSARHWHRYRTAYLLLAGLATPLVVSVHTVVAFDFTIAILPGWHSTIFPPLLRRRGDLLGLRDGRSRWPIPLRAAFGLQDFITIRHLDNMAKVLLATGMIVAYGYLMEAFMAWYGDNPYEQFVQLKNRPFGPYAHTYWMMIDLQRVHPPAPLVPLGSGRNVLAAVGDLDRREHRHVARAVRDRGHEPAPRLPAVVVGHVPRDVLGLRDVLRHARPVPLVDVPVHPLPAGDLDHRDARAGPRDAARAGAARASQPAPRRPRHESRNRDRPAVYGLLAEFDKPDDLVEATRHAYERGYRMMEAYTPFPVEGLAEALGFHHNRIAGGRPDRRPDRRAGRLLHAVVLGRGPLSARRRRPAVQ